MALPADVWAVAGMDICAHMGALGHRRDSEAAVNGQIPLLTLALALLVTALVSARAAKRRNIAAARRRQ